MEHITKAAKRVSFYLKGIILGGLLPYSIVKNRRSHYIRQFDNYSHDEQENILDRVHHLNRLTSSFQLPSDAMTFRVLERHSVNSRYYFDFAPFINSYHPDNRFNYRFGDVSEIVAYPSFVKSRPICADNENNILLKLDSFRHFYIPPEKPQNYLNKKRQVVWRGAAHQQERKKLLEQFHNNPHCDIGCVHQQSQNMPYHKHYMSIAEQRNYRYILSIEGNDVATNLKWILASNSLCMMRQPRFETWLCEAKLIPNHYYVLLKDDYSDLTEKIEYYNEHPDSAQNIIQNANRYMEQFANQQREIITSYLIMDKYFQLTGQL